MSFNQSVEKIFLLFLKYVVMFCFLKRPKFENNKIESSE